MGSQAADISWPPSITDSFDLSFDINVEEANDISRNSYFKERTEETSLCYRDHCNIPRPPPIPRKCSNGGGPTKYCRVPKETKESWDKLFQWGCGADVHVITDDGSVIAAHRNILSLASPVLDNLLKQSKVKNDVRCLRIKGLPYDAVLAFIRFIYSSCYEDEEMKKYVLHLLVLSHCFSVPCLKRVCEHLLEQKWLTTENVIDVLQLAQSCDAPRLVLLCTRMVVRDFKSISNTEGWKVMRRANPSLEQELIESVVEADTRKQEARKKNEEKKVYQQLHEAMEALIHICRDGCRTIGPRDKVLRGNQACGFQACKGLEALIRHFSSCKTRVPGGCVHCKRMWQLLELHSRMCGDPDSCKVPLCQHFKVKIRQQTKKDEAKWRLLVSKVMAVKNAQRLFSSRGSSGF